MRQIIYVLITLFLFTTYNLTNAQTVKSWTDKVDSPVLEKALRGGNSDFIVLLKEQADVSGARLIRGKAEKGTYVYNRLQKKAQETQARIIDMLEAENTFFQPYFLVNMIHAEGGADLVRRLAELPEVKRIVVNPVIQADIPVEQLANPRGITALEWGIEKINADDVWAMGVKGEGVVIGGQDTGYEWFHPALKDKYRGWDGASASHDYHWHDAIQEPINGDTNPCGYGASEPCDDHFHGTHTMGTMIGLDGENEIGVAPEAKWIGCRNMDKGFGTPVTYIDCFEWFLAPTDLNDENANPAMAPHVINNSWSCPESEGCFPSNFEVMEIAVNNLKAAGVVVVVSAGNSGSACETVNTPSAIFEKQLLDWRNRF
jgi:serine protease AprX